MSRLPPSPSGLPALRALRGMLRNRSLLTGLEVLHRELGEVYQIPMPGFRPVVLVGPRAAHFVYVTGREQLLWRAERDPVTRLLRGGLLVEDGAVHQALRRQMNPSLHRSALTGYAQAILARTDQISRGWSSARPVDMLQEMRRLTLLVLVDNLFGTDLMPELDRLWRPILRTLEYIGPGAWLLWRDLPRPGYRRARRQLDQFLYQLIADRRARPNGGADLLSLLLEAGLEDELIRDQLLTMLIAGHDTSTALLTWTLHLLGSHPPVLSELQQAVDQQLAGELPDLDRVAELPGLDQVLNESLRLYPPIHLSSRTAATDLEFDGYRIPAGTRVLFSIYLTHRQEQYWPRPERFEPERWDPQAASERPHYSFIPFGGGPRNCIGMAFARAEAQLILVRLLQRFRFRHVGRPVHPHMGATLEPRPAVWMQVTRRAERQGEEVQSPASVREAP